MKGRDPAALPETKKDTIPVTRSRAMTGVVFFLWFLGGVFLALFAGSFHDQKFMIPFAAVIVVEAYDVVFS